MFPPSLLKTANSIFSNMGGYEYASQYISDEEIIDTCLFSGIVITFSPKENAIYGLGGDYHLDYNNDYTIGDDISFLLDEVYDLSIYGYSNDKPYYVLDSAYNLLYYEYGLKIRHEGYLGTYFGLAPRDNKFIPTLSHGDIFYIQFETIRGPNIIKVIVNDRPHPELFSRYLHQYKVSLNSINTRHSTEVSLYTSNLPSGDLEIYTLAGDLVQNLSYSDIVSSPASLKTIQSSTKPVYIRVGSGIWFNVLLRQEAGIPKVNWSSKTLEEADYQLSLDAFSMLDPVEPQYMPNLRDTTLIYIKSISETSFIQTKLDIDRFSTIINSEVYLYTYLRMIDIKGQNNQALKEIAPGLYHVGINNKTNLIRSPMLLNPRHLNSSFDLSHITINAELTI